MPIQGLNAPLLDDLLAGVDAGDLGGGALGGLGSGDLLQGFVAGTLGGSLPLSIEQAPDGQNIETASARLAGFDLDVNFADDAGGGALPPVDIPGGVDSGVAGGFGGRSMDTVTLSGPAGFAVDFNNDPSHNTDASGAVGGQQFDTSLLEGFTDQSLGSVSTTGPVAADLLFEAGTGSATASSFDVGDALFDGTLLDGPGGSVDSLTVGEPIAASLAFGDAAGTDLFPLVLGGEGLQGSLLEGFGQTGIEDLWVEGIGTIIDHSGDGPEVAGGDLLNIGSLLEDVSAAQQTALVPLDAGLLDGLLA
jgi:hypothetical protein